MLRFVLPLMCFAALPLGVAAQQTAPAESQHPQARPVFVPEYADVRPVARPVAETDVAIRPVAPAEPAIPLVTPITVAMSTDTPDAAIAPLMSVPADQIAAAPVGITLSETVSTSSAPADIVASMAPDGITGPLALIAPGGPDDASFRPQLRPDTLAPQPPAQPSAAMRPSIRPYERPELERGAATRGELLAEQDLFAFSPFALSESLRPQVRPAAFVQRAEEQRQIIQRGQLCGDPAIQGEVVGRVPGAGSCGIENAVRVRSVAGIPLTSRAVMDCATATALKSWVTNGARPAIGDFGGGLESIRVIGTYSCRTRNGSGSNKLSEHAHGRAIDIAGFGLRNGSELTVLTDWNRQGPGAILRQMWRSACGPFGTVLGPNANAAHRDHFHFDTARYRSGSYCR